jgi:hypothetical protein
MARLGNAQLSDSKHYESYGVEEQENEDDALSSMKNSVSQVYKVAKNMANDGDNSDYSNM